MLPFFPNYEIPDDRMEFFRFPNEDDQEMGEVTLIDECGDPIGFEIVIDEDTFDQPQVPEPGDEALPDEIYDRMALLSGVC